MFTEVNGLGWQPSALLDLNAPNSSALAELATENENLALPQNNTDNNKRVENFSLLFFDLNLVKALVFLSINIILIRFTSSLTRKFLRKVLQTRFFIGTKLG